MQYLEWTAKSKVEGMKRELLDLVDDIHSKEQGDVSEMVDTIKTEMEGWQKNGFEPVNFEIALINKLFTMEQEAIRKKRFQENMADCDIISITRERIKQLKQICRDYHMQDYVKEPKKLSDHEMFNMFVGSTSDSFSSYKKGSNIDRVLHNT